MDMPQDCYWTVFNRREGALKSFKTGRSSARAKIRANAWQRRHRPHGTRVILICIPPRD